MKKIIFLIILIIALVAGIVLVQRIQDTRNKATVNDKVDISLTNNITGWETSNSIDANTDFTIPLLIDTKFSARTIDGFRTKICFTGSQIDFVGLLNINIALTNASKPVTTTNGKSCLDVIFLAKVAPLTTDVGGPYLIKIADLKFHSKASGSGQISAENSEVSGPAEVTDKSFGVQSVWSYRYNIAGSSICNPPCDANSTCNSAGICVPNAIVTVTPTPTTTVTPTPTTTITPTPGLTSDTLRYKISFVGVKPSGINQSCSNWPVSFKVGTQTVSSTPTKTTATKLVMIGGLELEVSVFEGQVDITGLTTKTGLSVFAKGPKHLQAKYGVNNQTAMYDQVNGQITLGTTTVYDFSSYPMLAGDVNQDGFIDGRDYVLIKDYLASNSLGNNEPNSPLDLDGNCLVNSGDTTIYKLSLIEKQGQLY